MALKVSSPVAEKACRIPMVAEELWSMNPDGYTEKMKELFRKAGIQWNEPSEI